MEEKAESSKEKKRKRVEESISEGGVDPTISLGDLSFPSLVLPVLLFRIKNFILKNFLVIGYKTSWYPMHASVFIDRDSVARENFPGPIYLSPQA